MSFCAMDGCGREDVIALTVQVRDMFGRVHACPEHLQPCGDALIATALSTWEQGFEFIERQEFLP